MNAQDYISSGLLEAYVLGALSEGESEQVAGAICRFAEVRQEIERMEASLFEAAAAQSLEPPPALQDRIWAELQKQSRPEMTEATAFPSPKAIPLPAAQRSPADADGAPRRKAFPLGMAAALVLLLASAAANLIIYQNSRETQSSLVAANTALKSELGQRETALQAMQQRYRSEAEMAADPDMQTVAMRSLKPGEAMAATMYWNAGRHQAYVSVQKLPPVPSGMQYQLWAIADGKPVSLGMIDNAIATGGGMQPVELPVAAGQAFAVSLETAGGVPSPTAERIMLMGKVPA